MANYWVINCKQLLCNIMILTYILTMVNIIWVTIQYHLGFSETFVIVRHPSALTLKASSCMLAPDHLVNCPSVFFERSENQNKPSNVLPGLLGLGADVFTDDVDERWAYDCGSETGGYCNAIFSDKLQQQQSKL